MGRKTEILKIKGDWVEVASDCRSTVGKPPLDHEPSVDFKRKILIAEHSPIRDISVLRSTSKASVQTGRGYRETNYHRTRLLTSQAKQMCSRSLTPCASACAASLLQRRGSMPRTLRRHCMRSSRKLRMCFVRAAYIAGDVRKCIRAERTRITLMC